MKSIFIILIVFTFSILSYSQEFAGRKIISGGASISTSIAENNSVFTGSVSLLYGKIKDDYTYLAYGGHVSYASGNPGNSAFAIGPRIEKGKFVKLAEDLYLNPVFGGDATVNFYQNQLNVNNSVGLGIDIYFSPLRFAYSISNSLMISAHFGSASFRANYVNEIFNGSLAASLSNNTGIVAFYTFK